MLGAHAPKAGRLFSLSSIHLVIKNGDGLLRFQPLQDLDFKPSIPKEDA